MLRRIGIFVAAMALAYPSVALPQSAAAGALKGLGDGLQRWAEMEQQRLQAQELMRQQYEYDMQRIERQNQLQMQQLDREEQLRREKAKQEYERQARSDERSRLDSAHPGWWQTVRSEQFKQWMDRQPASVQNLSKSHKADDAILMLDLFKRDTTR